MLERGAVPWERAWARKGFRPRSLQSGKQYRGVNVFLLSAMNYESPYWLTYKQAAERGGQVRKGEKGCPVVFWKEWKTDPTPGKWRGLIQVDENGKPLPVSIPVLRYYTVFNAAQCDGLDVPAIDLPEYHHDPITAAERIVSGMPKRPEIEHGHGRACYRPSDDKVCLPYRLRFAKAEDYYSVCFHELAHSTGHEDRLNRKGIVEPTQFGSSAYGQEELLAEMACAYLCGEAGILERTIERSAGYLGGWIQVLKGNPKLAVLAAAQAQKAADWILGTKFEKN